MGKNKQKSNNRGKYAKDSPPFELYFDDQIRLRKQIPAIEKTINGAGNSEWLNWFRGVFDKALASANLSQLRNFNNISSSEDIRRLIIERIVEVSQKNKEQAPGLVTLKDLQLPLEEAI